MGGIHDYHTNQTRAGGGLATVLGAGSALAGGFSRGDANTDILLNPARRISMPASSTCRPSVAMITIGSGVKATDGRFTDDYWIPSVAVAARPADKFGCALTYTQSFGRAAATYGSQAQTSN